jgi:hypothetical protein
MKLFKTQDNQIFAYRLDGSQDHLIGDKTPITQEQADEIIASRPVIEIPLNQILAQPNNILLE